MCDKIYVFPDDHRIGVTKNGNFYNLKTNKLLKKNIGNTGYYCISITTPGKKLKTYKCHRILAITFMEIPENLKNNKVSKIIVNHIDGNKLNIDLLNLEWTNNKGNIDHAYANELHTANKPVEIKNLLTGEITGCYSGGEVTRTYGIKKSTLFKHLNCDHAGQINYSGYAFRFKTNKEWPPIVKKKNLFIKILFIDNENKSTTFINLKAFCEKYKLKYRDIYTKVKEHGENITLNIGRVKIFNV